jgi:hypothetical protein
VLPPVDVCSLEEEASGILEELAEMQEEGGRGQEVLLEALPLSVPLVQESVLEDSTIDKTKKSRLVSL